MGCWNKFRLLMWKNWKLQSRKPIAFVIEIAIPLLIIAVFVLIRKNIKKNVLEEEIYKPHQIRVVGEDSMNHVRAYTPQDNKLINEIMTSFRNARPFDNATEMEKYLTSTSEEFPYYLDNIGIQFDQHMSQELLKNKNTSITFRFVNKYPKWHTEELFPPFTNGYNNREPLSNDGGSPGYSEVFAPLMCILTEKLLNYSGQPIEFPKMFIQRFPYPSYIQDAFLILLNYFPVFGFFFMTAFIYSHTNIVKSVTYEKEKQLKESMKIMGLPTWLHWTAWFCKYIIPSLIITIFLVVMMKYETVYGATLQHTDCCLLFIFFLYFLSAMITYSFALSVFFTKANRASAMAGILWVFSLVPYVMTRGRKPNRGAKYLSSLSITSAMAHGFDVILLNEGSMEGVHWGNLFKSDLYNDITFGGILLMMIADIILYMLIALYVEAIYPGEFGVPQKWYFIFTSEFWSTRKSGQDECLLDPNNGEFFDDDPTDLKVGISIKRLGKTFGSNEAVRNISLNMYEDQITVLLGHNGAGKTTTMSMLTGMFPPSKGTALVNGFDVRTQIMSVRDSMGVCPQHNVLFDELTVREHLIFFSRLKGCTGTKVEEEVQKFLKLLSLEDKADEKSTRLSGGMKRKLSVGIALCGNSKIIMLDEPTAGMDPTARRFIWELLQKQKKGRTILLTTHFMDEADLLGDRIAIMSGGILQCCGTSFFLKKKFGAGYHLVIDQMSTCNPNNITNVLRKYIPNIKIESNAGTELTYLLPQNYSPKFSRLLDELENNLEELGIRSFGISLTNLEEVFMKVGKSKTSKALSPIQDSGDGANDAMTNVTIGISNKEHGATLYVNQIIAIALKKLLSTKRTWGMELLKIILPLIFIILVFSIDLSGLINLTFKQRSFDLNQYDKPITLVETEGNLQDPYIHMLYNMKQKVEVTDNITGRLLDLTKKSPYLVRYRYIVGASFKDNEAYAWFNAEPYHSVPLSLQLLLQLNYKKALGDDFNINFNNFPLPKNESEEVKFGLDLILSNFNLLSLSLAVAFIGCFYTLFNIKEKISQAKHLQFVSGANIFIFRLVSFFCDMLTYLIAAIAIVITLVILKPDGMSTSEELGIMSLLLFSFGIAVIPWMYLFSFLFTIPSTAYSRMFFLSFLTGYPAEMIVVILKLVKWKHATLTQWIMRCFPHYNFIEGVLLLLMRGDRRSNSRDIQIFFSDGIYPNFLMLYMIYLIAFIILFLIDFNILSYLVYVILEKFKRPPYSTEFVDPDVQQETEFVKSQSLDDLQSQFVLVLRDLTKHFCRLTAVNGLNLTVKKSECFGLLGVNGAGKTTTFRMMTGDEMISYGDGWINGYSIRNEMKKVHRFIGYCPQFDALLDNLTARETIKIFSLIRGVPRDECNYTAEKLAKDFDFSEHLDKEVAQLSGGNKRKLSTAIALIGDSPIIFLDEPTTGMDPATKRHLWNNLSRIRESGKSIILTSHSMEECEALCTRLTIMVNGNFQCLGSVQHLKSKFAKGYCVTLKIRKPENSRGLEHSDTIAIENFMVQNFPTAELREKHQELLTYYIEDRNVKWSKLFGVLEQYKSHLNIEDYSIGQASLEQVFLSFTKEQHMDFGVRVRRGCCTWC